MTIHPEARGTSRTARQLGILIGRGVSPVEAAYRKYLLVDDLVSIRIDHWEAYDRGLIEGRKESE